MEERRKGRQTPTTSVVIPYVDTRGSEAIDLYNRTERTAMEWQELMLSDIMAVNDEGLWTHTKFGYSLPRRNGKSEIIIMRELWGFTNGEKILHTAHRTTTSHSSWERICDILSKAGFVEGEDYKTHKQYGLEDIVWCDKERPGKINFRTRSSKGGLGEGYDTLIIDEAQEYTDDQESALKYVVTDSLNPQTLMCGTPPTTTSSGTVFTKYRKNCLMGEIRNGGWAEWAVEFKTDCNDTEAWYETNPSLGTVFTERSVADEVGNDEVDFNIQRLGLWIQYNQKSAISKTDWDALKCEGKPDIQTEKYIGIKYGKDGTNVTMSIAVKTNDGKVFVEGIDCRPIRNGNDWIIGTLKAIKPELIAIDGASGQKILADELYEEDVDGITLPTVKEVIVAYSMLEQGIYGKTICHAGQPALAQAMTNCEKRAIGSNGGFGFKAQREGIEIGLLDSVALAHWLASTAKETEAQIIDY